MSYDDFDDNDDNGNGNESRLVKDLRKQLREANDAKKALETENTTLKSQVRTKSVEDVLADKKADKRIAQFIPADVTDEAGVEAWLEQNGDLFGYKPADQSDESGLSQDDQQGARDVQQLAGGDAALVSRQRQQLKAVSEAKTREELDALVFGGQQ